jgi:uncharacterized protein YndB with AHSA1/START domain
MFPPDEILLQVTLATPIATIWEVLTRPEYLVHWLAPRVNVDLQVGGPFELFWDSADPQRNSTLGCRILRLKEKEEVAFNWKGPAEFDRLMNQGAPLTEVSLSLGECPEGIDVTLIHSGWLAGEDWERARSWHFHTWERTLQKFKDYVLAGPGT